MGALTGTEHASAHDRENSSGITRRRFVRSAALAGAGLALGATTGCSEPTEIAEKPSFHFGKAGEMSQRVLIGYATKTGSTSGIAEKVGEVLGARGFDVDVKPVTEVKSLEGYSQVILGSAVNGGAWLPEALDFVRSKQDALGAVPFIAIAVHAMNAGSDEKATKKRLAYLDGVRALVKPVEEAFFLGKSPMTKDSSIFVRWAFRAFGGAGEGDLRDWDAIEKWARELELS